MTPGLRRARAAEIDALTALCLRSKAHWGYDADFMRQCRDTLRVSPRAVARGQVLVAVDAADRPLGVAQIDQLPDAADLALLFVDPPAMGRGVGRGLLRAAVQAASAAGARRLTILADPHAAGFYETLGARLLGLAPSDAIPGRKLPLYELAIDHPINTA